MSAPCLSGASAIRRRARAALPKRWLAALSAVASLAAGCNTAPDPGRISSRLRASLPDDPSLTLVGKTDRNGEIVASLLSEGLVRYDASLRLQPRIARSWEVSPDGLTWTFRLREGVKWHDGTPVTADDVVFTVEKVRDPKTISVSYLSNFDTLASIEALDETTVRATYKAPFADALESWTLPLIPRHLAGKDADFLAGEFSRHPVGCGPFRFVRAEPGREIVLAANDGYWDGRPHLDEIVLRVIRDQRTAFQLLMRGELDLLVVAPDFWRAAREQDAGQRLKGEIAYQLTVWYIGWGDDGSNPFFGDARVRRAMVLALDRERFAQKALDGLARVAVGSYHPDSPWFDTTLKPWPYDPAAARTLLDGAGWRDTDGDGVRDRGGAPFSFTLMIPASSQDLNDRVAAWVQDSLAKIGVRVAIEKLEWQAFQERRRAHKFQAAVASLIFMPAPDQFAVFHSSSIQGGFNYGGFNDPEVDRLLDAGRRTFDVAARQAIYHELQRRLHDLEPISCLFHFAVPTLHDARLMDIELSPLGLWATTPGPRAWRWTGAGRVD